LRVSALKLNPIKPCEITNDDKPSSDIHFWKTGRIGSLVVEGDCILGHEAAGVVLQVGEGVTNLKSGMKNLPAKTI
jgi:NADPH:quinone reductase-like Zn-dependent oxidoreductase